MGVIGPGDACTNTGRLVIEVLQENHPLLQEIYAAYPINSTFGLYEYFLYAVPLDISGSGGKVPYHIGGTGGPGGAYVKVIKAWCIRFSSD